MSRDESGTLAALKAHRHEVIEPRIEEYGGRIVKTMGDGLLLEFGSAVDAVRCCVDVQRAMAERNLGVAADARIDFRVGINVGDIIIDGDDIYGNGVNVAARLETMAEPGGICISGKVYGEIADKVDCHFEDRGLQRVKNIALPVQVYAVGLLPAGTPVVPAEAIRAAAAGDGSPLYGRAQDLAALRRLIEQHALITVVGPAGIGKTRLAQAIVHDLRDTFAERVTVELAPLADPALVVNAVALALGIVVRDARSALDLAVQALAGQRMLLVLDNCEHVLDAVDEVVTALRRGAPDVRILATSQELLRQPDEHVYRLGTLALPGEATFTSAREAGAVELFVARAQAVEPRFRLDERNFRAVVDVCRRLDGIPLAIELAAARVPLLGVEGVRQRLDERFRLLTAGSRLALRRHQTLRAALEWSYSLLSEPEQAVFDRLGAFAGSFSLECAQKLAADEAIDEWTVLDHLGALVDKSLVSVEEGDSVRYRLLETTRAFALERLAARGATRETMRRHAEIMLDVFERMQHELGCGTPSVKASEALTSDLDNLRGALRWAANEESDRRVAIALFGAAVANQGYFVYAALQAREWIDTLRPLVDAATPKAEAARFWLACGGWGAVHGVGSAAEDATHAIALYRDLGDRLGGCRAWTLLAYALMNAGKSAEAKAAVDEAFRLRDPAWPVWLRALVDNMASLVLISTGDLGAARTHALELLAASRQVSTDVDVCASLAVVIDIDIATGALREAVSNATELVEHHPALWEGTEDGRNLRIAATALMLDGRLDEAERLYREAALRARRNYGNASLVLGDAALLPALRGRIADAARVLAYVERVYEAQGASPRGVALQLRGRLQAQLADELPPETLARLAEEGRRLNDEEACALAFR